MRLKLVIQWVVSFAIGALCMAMWSRLSGAPETPPPQPTITQAPAPSPTIVQKREVAPPVRPKEAVPLRVVQVQFNQQDRLTVRFNREVTGDYDLLRQHISVEPQLENALMIRPYGYDRRLLDVQGDFALETNLVLRIRAGLPGRNQGVSALQKDYSYRFQRERLPLALGFERQGSYLPPTGMRAVVVQSTNIDRLKVTTRRLEPNNITQFLARKTDQYARAYYGGHDDYGAAELAGARHERYVRIDGVSNQVVKTVLPILPPDRGQSNGVFLVELTNAKVVTDEPVKAQRLICISDIGLNVRHALQKVCVWATSLTSGKPLAGLEVKLFSVANVAIGQGVTDQGGWCEISYNQSEEPFAVVASTKEQSDMAYIALHSRFASTEQFQGTQGSFLKEGECVGSIWIPRSIFRHGERIPFNIIIRNDQRVAPKPFPIELRLISPTGKTVQRFTRLPDENGVLCSEEFSVAESQPSGAWRITASLPGEQEQLLASRKLNVEAFVPPQIRLKLEVPTTQAESNFTFSATCSYLFGGEASNARCEALATFSDAPFAPKGWEEYTFGNELRGFESATQTYDDLRTDANGICRANIPFELKCGLPKAAVRAIAQITAFDDGNRPNSAHAVVTRHYYPRYIGAKLPTWLDCPSNQKPTVPIVCLLPSGAPATNRVKLTASLYRLERSYVCRQVGGSFRYESQLTTIPIVENRELFTQIDGTAIFTLPTCDFGEYRLAIDEVGSNVSFLKDFYLSSRGSDGSEASYDAKPRLVMLTADKPYYRAGDIPRISVKAPFRGHARLTVMRDRVLYSRYLELTNTTSEITLDPIRDDLAPNINVSLILVQGGSNSPVRIARRSHGEVTLPIHLKQDELSVEIKATTQINPTGGATVKVRITAPHALATAMALVDEGIQQLTNEPIPNPLATFWQPRYAPLMPYDYYCSILPIVTSEAKDGNVKTGGDGSAPFLRRVSPIESRRFKPLALWQAPVAISNGVADVIFTLPEFSGEVRLTAIAWNQQGVGVASKQEKVTYRLVMKADAPRFVAPNDSFNASLALHNRSGEDGEVEYRVAHHKGLVRLAAGQSTNFWLAVTAPSLPGHQSIDFIATGFGETHQDTIELPIRPATPWQQSAGVVRLEPNEGFNLQAMQLGSRLGFSVCESPLAETITSLEWLADYPYGCLEQTCSRIFPLLVSDGLLNSVASPLVVERADYIRSAVARVESMLHYDGFSMWPRVNELVSDQEIALYATHFLMVTYRAGFALDAESNRALQRVRQKEYVGTARSYACYLKALANSADDDELFALYHKRDSLSLLERARLARSFLLIHDKAHATELMKGPITPSSIKDATWALLALLEIDYNDARIAQLIAWIQERREPVRNVWGTTHENAHALIAIASYYSRHPAKPGLAKTSYTLRTGDTYESGTLTNKQSMLKLGQHLCVTNNGSSTGFLSWRKVELAPAQSTNTANGLSIQRRFLRTNGQPLAPEDLRRGERIYVELTLKSHQPRRLDNLVIEDLFCAAFEPIREPITAFIARDKMDRRSDPTDWILTKEVRDDRLLIFSNTFELQPDEEARFYYPIRVVSSGSFALPGPSVEAMYQPDLRARGADSHLVVAH